MITGIGLTAPNGNSLPEFREALLNGRSGVQKYDIRYVGETLAGICNFDELKYQKKKEVRRGTRAGSIGIYCAQEAVADSGLDWANIDRERVGVYIGVTEHGNVETENEIYEIKGYDYDTIVWSHHHNPRTVANNPAGEITLNMGITGPHYTIGAACAAGNAGMIQGAQMLRLGECDVALAGGVSESIHTFGIFAGFASQGALAKHDDPTKASRPFDMDRNGIVVSEGGCLYVLERFDDAKRRGAKIYGELVGYAMNSDASDFVLPNPSQQARCMDTGAQQGPAQRVRTSTSSARTPPPPTAATSRSASPCERFSTTARSPPSTTRRASSATRWGPPARWNWPAICPAFDDNVCHATINVDRLDPECALARPRPK